MLSCPTGNSTKCIPTLLFLMGAAPLVLALISQYGFALSPCHLCIWQRYPYGIVMALAVLALILPRFLKVILALAAAAFFTDAAIALLHTGVERQWWQGKSWWPDVAHLLGLQDCSGAGTSDSIEDLRAKLLAAPVARCDQPQFIFLGLSMASWNGLYALGAMFVALKLGCCSRKGACDAKE